MEEMDKRASAPGEPPLGGIIVHLLNYLMYREPRTEFISLQKLMFAIMKQYHDKSFRRELKKISGFENFLDGYQRLLDLSILFGCLSNWKVDRYLQLARFQAGIKEFYGDAEIEALDQLYINENGNNDKKQKMFEEVLSAELIEEDLAKERDDEEVQEEQERVEHLEELPF